MTSPRQLHDQTQNDADAVAFDTMDAAGDGLDEDFVAEAPRTSKARDKNIRTRLEADLTDDVALEAPTAQPVTGVSGPEAAKSLDERQPYVETDHGRMRTPPADIYPGEPPYGAPVIGFKGKIHEIFDAFAYFPASRESGGTPRPEGFMPIIGISADDPVKEKNRAHWQLYAKLQPQVWKEVRGHCDESRPTALLVTDMRSENLCLISVTQTNTLFNANVWAATMPLRAGKTPVRTLNGDEIAQLLAAEQAKRLIGKKKPAASAQLSLAF